MIKIKKQGHAYTKLLSSSQIYKVSSKILKSRVKVDLLATFSSNLLNLNVTTCHVFIFQMHSNAS